MLLRRSSETSGIWSAGTWAISGSLIGRALDVLSVLVLARLLTPADFGLVAMGMTVSMLIEAATQIPLIQPIIRTAKPDHGHYDTAFSLGLIRSVVLALLVLVSAPLAAAFFDEPRLPSLVAVLAVAPILRGMVSPRLADFVRAYDTRPDFAMNVTAKFVSMVALIVVAARTGSYWAIAVGTVTTPTVLCALSYVLAPYRPRLGLTRWSDFADIVGWGSVGQLVSAIDFQIDRIILGGAVSATDLGRFSLSRDLSSIPVQALVFPLAGPIMTAFSRGKDRGDEARVWAEAANALFLLVGGTLLALACLSEAAVYVLLGPAWLDSAGLLALFALSFVPALLRFIFAPLALASHRAHLVIIHSLVTLLVAVPAVVIGLRLGGLAGAITGRLFATALGASYALFQVRHLAALSFRRQAWAAHRSGAGLLALAAVTALMAPEVDAAEVQRTAELIGVLARAALALAAGGLALVTVLFGLWAIEGRPDGVEHRLRAVVGSIAGHDRLRGLTR